MGVATNDLLALSQLLDVALSLPPAERASWIETLGGEQTELKPMLRELLGRQDLAETGSFLATLPKITGPQESVRIDAEAGDVVGTYRLERALGAGGMGSVWLAERVDGLLKRKIALKLPHLGGGLPGLAERMARERNILAALEHPSIARLYDAGVATDGRPYLALEYVEGEPIDNYCERHRLDVPARVELVLQIARAVAYAHTRLVVHRDIKPSNILVDAQGQVHLLDFGIAKLLDSGGPAQTRLTQAAGTALTPEYASPEQIRGDVIGTPSDVYSVGVVIYELLAGTRPYKLRKEANVLGLAQAVLSAEPLRPSAAIADAAARRRLRGDLDTIILKALKKNPVERYANAGELAADIERHLRGEPVRAQPDSTWYRTRKYVGRNAWAVGAAASVFVALGLGLVIGGRLLFPRPAPEQATSGGASSSIPATTPGRLTTAFAPPPHSIAVLPFVNMSGDAKEEYFSDGISEELLNSLSRVNGLQVAARTSSFSFKGQHVDVSEIAHKLNVGAILEGSVRRAGTTVRITAQLIDAVSGFQLWSQTYDRDFSDILKVQTEVATAVARQLEGKLGGDEAAEIELGGTQNPQAYDAYLRGEQALASGDWDEAGVRAASKAFDEAIALDPNYARAYLERARALADIGNMFTVNPDRSARLLKQSRLAAERGAALAPDLGDAHKALGATSAWNFGDLAAAAPEFERAIALAPGSAEVQRRYADFSAQLGHYEIALKAAHRAVSLDPRNVSTHFVLGNVLLGLRRYGEALAAYQTAKALDPHYSSSIEGAITDALIASGQAEQARRRCETPAPVGESAGRHGESPGRHSCLAVVYHALGRPAEAERELALLKALKGDRSAYDYAEIYAQWGNTAAALQWLTKAYRLRDRGLEGLREDWMLDPIRNEPEFKALEARLNLPP